MADKAVITVRATHELSEAVKKAAAERDMSVNKFIIDRLKRAVKVKKTG